MLHNLQYKILTLYAYQKRHDTCRQRDNDVVILELLKLFFFADGCFWCLKTHQKQLYHWVRVLSPFGSNETHILLRVEHIKVILLLVPFLPHSEGDWGFWAALSFDDLEIFMIVMHSEEGKKYFEKIRKEYKMEFRDINDSLCQFQNFPVASLSAFMCSPIIFMFFSL